MVKKYIACFSLFYSLIMLAAPAWGDYTVNSKTYTNRVQIGIDKAASHSSVAVDIQPFYDAYAISDDGAFEWHSEPCERYVGTHDRTYVAYITSGTSSDIVVQYWDSSTETMSEPVVVFEDFGNGDDHACPSVYVVKHSGDHQGKILVAAAEHGGKLWVRRSTNAEDISSWEATDEIASDDSVYAQIVELSDGTLYLFSMDDASDDYRYCTSSDGGGTWGSWTKLTDFDEFAAPILTYCHVVAKHDGTGTKIHAMFNVHYAGTHRLDIWYAVFDGTNWKEADGTTITLPIDQTNGDCAYETAATNQANLADHSEYTMLWDIKLDATGNPYMISLSDVGDETWPITGPCTVRRHYYDSGWQTETVVEDASLFGSYYYPGGAILDETDMDTVYVCADDGSGVSQIEEWTKDGTWSKTDTLTDTAYDNCRPIYVKNGAGYFKILWTNVTAYTNYTAGNWTSSLMSYPGFNNRAYFSCGGGCQTDFDDIVFTSSGGTLLGVDGTAYRVSKTDSHTATFRVNVGAVTGGTRKYIYAYWGNATDTYPSPDTDELLASLESVDEFSGAAIDTDIWEGYTENASVADGVLTYSDNTSAIENLLSKETFSDADVYFRAKLRTAGTKYLYCGVGNATNTERSYAMIISDGSDGFWTSHSGSSTSTNWDMPDNTWTQYRLQYTASTSAIWTVDGTERANHTTNVPTTALPLCIGTKASSGSEELQVDYVRLYRATPGATVRTYIPPGSGQHIIMVF